MNQSALQHRQTAFKRCERTAANPNRNTDTRTRRAADGKRIPALQRDGRSQRQICIGRSSLPVIAQSGRRRSSARIWQYSRNKETMGCGFVGVKTARISRETAKKERRPGQSKNEPILEMDDSWIFTHAFGFGGLHRACCAAAGCSSGSYHGCQG